MDVLDYLCYHNPLSPDYDEEDEKDDPQDKSKQCYCDNCFYGRDELAKEILKLTEQLKEKK